MESKRKTRGILDTRNHGGQDPHVHAVFWASTLAGASDELGPGGCLPLGVQRRVAWSSYVQLPQD